MATESSAAFRSRALDLGLAEDRFELLVGAGVRNFGQYAFICQYQPGSSDEGPLLKVLSEIYTTDVNGGELTVGERSILRRLYFESHTTAVQEMRIRLERQPDDTPKAIPMAERIERLNAFKESHCHLVLDYSSEPSHKLVVLVCQQAESQVVSYIELSLCTSRETEITHRKKETQVSIDNSGLIKLTKQDREVKTEVTGDLKVRQCMQRRVVAYHLANIATYKTLEKFTAKLFHYLTKEPVASHRPISLQQNIQADRELWIQVSQTTRGKILTSNPKPIDEAVAKLSESTEVLYHLMPLPQGSQPRAADKPKADRSRSPRRPKGKGNKNKGKGGGKGTKPDLPANCVFKDDQGRNICFAYQWGKCQHPGPRCSRGMHLCWTSKCHGSHPYTSCPSKKQ